MSNSISLHGPLEACPPTPKELDFPSHTAGKWEDEPDNPVYLDNMHCTESALGNVSLPPKACFVLGKLVHV